MVTKLLLSLVCYLFLFSPRALAATLTVSPGSSIQSAVNSAQAGDTITVNTGTYSGKTTVSKSNLIIQANGKVTTKHFEISGHNNIIRGFTITDPNENSGIFVSGNDNLIENNEIYHTKQDGIWFFGHGNVFRGNHVHDILDPSVCGPSLYTTSCNPHVDCYQTWGSSANYPSKWETRDIVFEGNLCIHGRTMGDNQTVMLENQSSYVIQNITFRNNIFVMHEGKNTDPTGGTTIMNFHRKEGQAEIKDIHVLNNTFYNVTLNTAEAIKFSGITGGRVVNNVTIGFSKVFNATNGSAPTVSNNISSGNYGMVNYQNLDFSLTPGSPLINAGTNIGVTIDYRGQLRDNLPDIGAFEYASSTPSPTPKPGDLNGDGSVNLLDFNQLIKKFGNPYTLLDFNAIISHYGN